MGHLCKGDAGRRKGIEKLFYHPIIEGVEYFSEKLLVEEVFCP